MAATRKNIYPWLLMGGGMILILIWLAGVLLIKLPGVPATPTPYTVGQVQRVSLSDARKAFDAGSAVFLDVRDANSYARSHITGALSIPISDLTNRMQELNPKSWIITYCT